MRSKSAIAEISTRVRGADKNTGAPCDATASGVFRQLPDLLPVFYPDLEKEFSEVRSGSEIGRVKYRIFGRTSTKNSAIKMQSFRQWKYKDFGNGFACSNSNIPGGVRSS